jgi:ATP-dependent DNA helicase RecQ
MEAMIRYATSDNKCRSQQLLTYFGEGHSKRCGHCDVCVERNKISLNELEFNNILEFIKPLLKTKPCTIGELVEAAENIGEDKVIRAIRWLIDNEKIEVNKDQLYRWK